MTKSGFDLNEIEQIRRFAHRAVDLLPRQDRRQELVEARTLCILIEDAARNSLPAMLTEIRELRAENARLREVVSNYVDPFNVAPEDEALVERVQRAALGEPQ